MIKLSAINRLCHERLIHLSLVFLVSFLLWSCNERPVPSHFETYIFSGWEFSGGDSSLFLPADVPGCIHLDLIKNGMIPDPYFRNNEALVQWVGNKDWTYRTTFPVTDEELGYDSLELVFGGLDTYADVFLNDKKILVADNMFRQWIIGLNKGSLKPVNELKVHFSSAVRVNHEKAEELPYPLPDERAFSRKAPYQFGWDWGPTLVTCGIWKPVSIRGWNRVRIDNFHVHTVAIDSSGASMKAFLDVYANLDMSAELVFEVPGILKVIKQVALSHGDTLLEIPFHITEPDLWWVRSLGDPHLYEAMAKIRSGSAVAISGWEKFGVRTIELINEPDETGRSFYFKLNGVPVFMKGANYIPPDDFLPRVGISGYRSLIRDACRSNMNMLRVWGGGVYGDDRFYDLCDSAGILVWQDFMFAGTMYPPDTAFEVNVEKEASQQVVRLAGHPCIALWCGNNEVDEGWKNWGWQDQLGYSDVDSTELWNAYLHIFHEILPKIVQEMDPGISYWPSSPEIGWGHPESLLEGDSHYWGVWWGHEPFEMYDRKVGRFMSEYGFQGYPSLVTIKAFTDPQDRQPGSRVLVSHQKHPFGEKLIREYMERDYPVPSSLGDYVYVSQLNQAEGITRAIEAHRRAMPRCMGTLYWQLNDCWPAISWSGIDYYGRWKALQYFVARAYNNIMLSVTGDRDDLKVWVVSDMGDTEPARMDLFLYNTSGSLIDRDSARFEVKPGSKKYYERKTTQLLKGAKKEETFLYVKIRLDNGGSSEIFHYFTRPKDLKLDHPELNTEVIVLQNEVSLTIQSDCLAKNIFLDFNGIDGWFSDNYFDLLPGTRKTVRFIPEGKISNENLREELRIKTLNGILLQDD